MTPPISNFSGTTVTAGGQTAATGPTPPVNRWTRRTNPARPAAESDGVSRSQPMRTFDDFYRDHRDEIGRALVFTLRDRSLGEEAVDEAMTKAYQRWNTLAPTENPAGWVYVVGLRWALSWRRGRRREQRREVLVAGQTPDTVGGAEAEFVDLWDALGELAIDHRTVVVCRFSLGMSVRETADALNIREGTVKSRLSRAMDQLRQLTEAPS